jgi:pimeloyl-ACP methyl ester carboxylesterase
MSKFPDLVVLIPGITGSVLVNAAGNDVWKPSISAAWRAITDSTAAVDELKLTSGAENDGLTASALVPGISIVPGLVKIEGYSRIASFLVEELGLERGENFHEFPYDWRRDNRVSAQRLQQQAVAWLGAWREKSGNEAARLILIGHSMGGLVARYFFECLEGWRVTRMIMTLGTPYSGSLEALGFLERGMKKSIGPMGIDLSPALRSMPSVYQLLPNYRCIAISRDQLLHVHEAASMGVLSNVDPEFSRQAKAFHDEISEAAEVNKLLEGYPSSSSTLVPFVGIQQPTAQSAILLPSGLKLVNALRGHNEGGDGIVPRSSASPVGWDARLNVYAGDTHGALQNASGTLINIKGLATMSTVDIRQFLRSTSPSFLSLKLNDVVPPGDKLDIRARRSSGNAPIYVELVCLENTQKVQARLHRHRNTVWQRGIFDLQPGVWRVTVSSEGAEPVHDIAIVAQS